MISGAPVPKVSVLGSTTPTDFLVPSAKVKLWLTHLPSKYTLAAVVRVTLGMVLVVMALGDEVVGVAGNGGNPDFTWCMALARWFGQHLAQL